MDQHESPTERFKRVISQATRALSAEPETEVKFGGDRPAIDGIGEIVGVAFVEFRLGRRSAAATEEFGEKRHRCLRRDLRRD